MGSSDILAKGPPAPGGGESDIIGGYAAPVAPKGPLGPYGPAGPSNVTPPNPNAGFAREPYLKGAERQPASWPVEEVAALQQAMSRAGVLTGAFSVGVWDNKSRSAYTNVLSLANQQGVEALDALDMFASAPKAGGRAPFDPGRYLPPDPAVHRQAVRAMFAEALDREPDDDELDDYVAALRRSERRAFRQARGAYVEGAMAGGSPTASAFNAELSRAQEDVGAVFMEKFQQRTAGEREFKIRQSQAAEQSDLLSQIIGSIDEVA